MIIFVSKGKSVEIKIRLKADCLKKKLSIENKKKRDKFTKKKLAIYNRYKEIQISSEHLNRLSVIY